MAAFRHTNLFLASDPPVRGSLQLSNGLLLI